MWPKVRILVTLAVALSALANGVLGEGVLCIGADGHFAIEPAGCDRLPQTEVDPQAAVLTEQDADCGPCADLLLLPLLTRPTDPRDWVGHHWLDHAAMPLPCLWLAQDPIRALELASLPDPHLNPLPPGLRSIVLLV